MGGFGVIPAWKIYRELDRTRQMLFAGVASLFEPFIQARHDRNRDTLLAIHDGTLDAKSKVAILLIFQPRGVSPTVYLTCKHLEKKGYVPLVISNTPLGADDLAQLSACTWKTIVRPNYGYDFGGYRDGILWLQDQGLDIDRLLILNDSIWFPVWPDETLIDRMEDMACGLSGAVIHRSVKRRNKTKSRPAFLESYFYLINRSVIESASFKHFWRDYRVSSIKFNAVYRGERNFSPAMEAEGHSVEGVVDANAAVAAISTQTDEFLRKTIEYGAYTDPEFEAERDSLLAQAVNAAGWHEAALTHITKVILRRSAYASFPYASFHLLAMPIVKKSRLMFFGKNYGTVQIKMRTQLLRAIAAGDIQAPFPEVLAEMLAIEPDRT